jgi:hypothetical protein
MSVIGAILGGELDEDLERITMAVKERRNQLQLLRVSELRVGQRVRLDKPISPHYLRGVRGEVVRVSASRLAILVDDAYRGKVGRFMRPDGTIEAPYSTVFPE